MHFLVSLASAVGRTSDRGPVHLEGCHWVCFRGVQAQVCPTPGGEATISSAPGEPRSAERFILASFGRSHTCSSTLGIDGLRWSVGIEHLHLETSSTATTRSGGLLISGSPECQSVSCLTTVGACRAWGVAFTPMQTSSIWMCGERRASGWI